MSLSTYLFWGVDLGDMQDSQTWESWAPAWMLDENGSLDYWDPDDHLAGKLGWTPTPFPDHLFEGESQTWKLPPSGRESWRTERRDTPEYRAWSANEDRKRELLKTADLGCEISQYGAAEGDLQLYVAVIASAVGSDAWTCEPITETVRGDGADYTIWRDKLTRYLQLLDIPLDKAGPMGWYMTGYYG